MTAPDDFTTEHPKMVAVPANVLSARCWRNSSCRKGLRISIMHWPMMTSSTSTCQDNGQFAKSGQNRSRAADSPASTGIMEDLPTLLCVLPMLLTRLLNACHRFPGFVYEGARLNETTKTIEMMSAPDAAPSHTAELAVNPHEAMTPCQSGVSSSSRSGASPWYYCTA